MVLDIAACETAWLARNPAYDGRFFIGSDYPHAEGFVHPIRTTRELLAALPERSVEKILCDNAAAFYRI